MANERSLQNLRPFPKGQSGNPGGEVKNASITNEVRKILASPCLPALAEKVLGKKRAKEAAENGFTMAQLIALVAITMALKGNVKVMALVWAYADGAPPKTVTLDGTIEHSATVAAIREAIGIAS